MSARKSPPDYECSSEALVYEDVSLIKKYSVMEIAMLAAGCRGDTREERISDAVELLALVERYALAGKETRNRIRQRKKAKERGSVKISAASPSKYLEPFKIAARIRDTATRDNKTGKIELTSLVGLAYQFVTGGKADSSEAMRRFNKWVEGEAGELAISVEAYKARFKSGSKLSVLHDDNVAWQIAMEFMVHLAGRPSKPRKTKILQSQKPETKGEIVSPKTRGSAIADGTEGGKSKAGKARKAGQFKPKQPVVVEEYEDSHRNARTRMGGERLK